MQFYRHQNATVISFPKCNSVKYHNQQACAVCMFQQQLIAGSYYLFVTY